MKRQTTVSLSSCEAEYVSLAAAAQEALWLKGLMAELLFADPNTIVVNCDSKSAIDLCKTSTYRPRSKHIDIKFHFIRDLVFNHELTVQHVPTDSMVADIFTKALSSAKHSKFSRDMGLKFAVN